MTQAPTLSSIYKLSWKTSTDFAMNESEQKMPNIALLARKVNTNCPTTHNQQGKAGSRLWDANASHRLFALQQWGGSPSIRQPNPFLVCLAVHTVGPCLCASKAQI